MKYRTLFVALLAFLTAACSAIVNPDEADLGGGTDSGGGTLDSGGGTLDSGRADGGRDGATPPDDAGVDGGTDAGPECPGGCDDGVACTTDTCAAPGACENNPSDALCGVDERCNPSMGCVSIFCTTDAECDDGLWCTGRERCAPGGPGADPVTGCVAGVPPVCDDGFDCTTDACDEGAGDCAFVPDDALCDDGIDCTIDACDAAAAGDPSGCVATPDDTVCDTSFCVVGGFCSVADGGCVAGVARDCRDGDICTADSCDDATRMCVHEGRDADGDGYPAARYFGRTCPGGTDCNDGDPSVHPMATELCNMRDDNCNGLVDELCTPIPDTCADAEQIMVSVGGAAARRTGRLGDFRPNYGTLCGRNGAPDAVYYIDVPSLSDVTIDTIGSATDTVLAVGTTCSNAGFRMGCDDDIDTGVTLASRVWVHRIGPTAGGSPTRLYILVDGYDRRATGAYTLNVTIAAAAADRCTAPIDISGGGTMAGFIGGGAIMIGGPTGSCQGPGARLLVEAVATFTGPPDGDSRMAVYSNDFDPDVYIRHTPCGSGIEVGCVAGDGGGAAGFTYETTLTAATAAGSRYYVFADGANRASQYIVSFEP